MTIKAQNLIARHSKNRDGATFSTRTREMRVRNVRIVSEASALARKLRWHGACFPLNARVFAGSLGIIMEEFALVAGRTARLDHSTILQGERSHLSKKPARTAAWVRLLYVLTRYLKLTAVPIAGLAGVLVAAAWLTPMPRLFTLDSENRGITTPFGTEWQRLSNWVHHRKYVVLTFDDGPIGDGMDDRFLATLRRHHAHALFFLICNRINDRTGPTIGEMEREGHMIGNHSLDHMRLTALPAAELSHQIDACSSQIAAVTGHRPKYVRPPFGGISSAVERAVTVAGARPMLWSASSYDYLYRDPRKIQQLSVDGTADMSILLMHERPYTEQALDEILTRLEAEGFTFVLPT